MKNHQPQTFLPVGHDVQIFQTLQEKSRTFKIRNQEVTREEEKFITGIQKDQQRCSMGSLEGQQNQPENEFLLQI